MPRPLVLRIIVIAFLSPGPSTQAAGLTFARPFADHMVLPHGHDVPVWGTGKSGAEVKVAFAGHVTTSRCDENGVWKVTLPALRPSAEERELHAKSGDTRITIRDVLVGEVWLFSGQSNMDWPLSRSVGGGEAVRQADHPGIRLFNLSGAPTDGRRYGNPERARLNPKDHFQGTWQRSTPQSAAGFSAIGWWFAEKRRKETGIPVGIVENAIGGSGTEAWLPLDVLGSRPEYAPLLGPEWLDAEKISPWARDRARRNLGENLDAPHPFRPGFLFESGVRWWAGFPFTGVVWYQGETNAELNDPAWNTRLIKDLVTGWRGVIGRNDLPFHLIQLPRIGGSDPLRRFWPEYREAQAEAARKLPGVHLVKTMDLGWDSPDVHPPDKHPVAERLHESVLKR